MLLPKLLEDRIQDALNTVRAQPEHVLNLGYRAAIWAAMGPVDRFAHPATHEGKRRRTLLALYSARHVLPLWEQRWPENKAPHEAIGATEQLLWAPVDDMVFYDTLDQCAEAVERFITRDFVKSRAGESAVLALSVGLEDEFFDPDQIDYGWIDGQLGGGDDDASSTASIAYAGGTALTPGSDRKRRLEFWEWWLSEAVPMACCKGTLEEGEEHIDLS